MAKETFIMKKRELLDGTGRIVYLVLDESGAQVAQLTCTPDRAKEYMAAHGLTSISYAQFLQMNAA
jgi:hypothetical protein